MSLRVSPLYLSIDQSFDSSTPSQLQGTQAGAIFVNRKAETYFERIFTEANYDEKDIRDYSIEGALSFELEGKKSFDDPEEEMSINFGERRLNDAKLKIRRGRIAMRGYVHSHL